MQGNNCFTPESRYLDFLIFLPKEEGVSEPEANEYTDEARPCTLEEGNCPASSSVDSEFEPSVIGISTGVSLGFLDFPNKFKVIFREPLPLSRPSLHMKSLSVLFSLTKLMKSGTFLHKTTGLFMEGHPYQ